ncbi:HAD superfamily hydrolase (TIGR01549 family) [Allofrancisella inopinata]|uniref:phosphoglycolate phosphatase n=1 Tax=Allofrancisella inopinata TaxID=1085647 RepID=A0AAE7CRL4_9GAMM|nr:HAD-IA family hydrolase [Allofrancisella inopinata]QIV96494.1 HAD family hydrolase [Allofrancisella inopinata]TDT68513.1 HAD superfamily hydrolase (TIGR01549 family) [Allofrancisella inopinata]
MIRNIIFDFDGVILDSVSVKTQAYRDLFKKFDKKVVDRMISYHERHGGVSRYLKVKYFFNQLLGEGISDEDVVMYANRYSELTKQELSQKKYLIRDTVDFIKRNQNKYNMHVASAADHNDLICICKELEIVGYFKSIQGSPKLKSDIIKEILLENKYQNQETVLIGDSINDYEAAEKNDITFYGYNNLSLKDKCNYIYDFKEADI